MSKIINQETQSAYERWELPAVDDTAGSGATHQRLLTAGQIEKLQKLAYEEGFNQGTRDGLAAGKHLLDAQVTQLQNIIQSLQEPLLQADEHLVQQLVDMSILIAAQVIRRELRADPGQVVAAVRECMRSLPAGASQIRLYLHPEDALIVRNAFSIDDNVKTWTIIEEPVLSRGGCRVETQYSKIDASIEQQLNRVIANLLGDEREKDHAG
ncbi:MAG: flagellar assembly protein FliH [Gammaproteobacteria bacterium]|nr:flagellar assembly protein FliH [Gammaproteobacteria bacterium]